MTSLYSKTISLARTLVSRASLTPDDCDCSRLIARELHGCGFNITYYNQKGCTNLFATHGIGAPFILFLGHTDVVPPGDRKEWDHDPFCGSIIDYKGNKVLFGRGSADMKGSDAAMTVALCSYIQANPGHKGTLGLLITSNEEGDGQGGVKDCAQILKDSNQVPDFCIVGEPSCASELGDTVKVGRRGSLSILITVHGVQGHVAYPHKVHNPIHDASRLIDALMVPVDDGSEFFPPTSFEVTNIKAGTGAENVVPGSCEFLCNYRFNNLQSLDSLKTLVEGKASALGIKADFDYRLNGEPFVCSSPALKQALSEAIFEHTGLKPSFSTSGGTSDGRFIAPLGCEVLEFGPVSATIHQANECVKASDLDTLTLIYQSAMANLLKQAG